MPDRLDSITTSPSRDVLDQFPKLLALVSAAILVMAACHEWAYFLVVDPSFQSLMSAYDYVANAIVYLPSYLITTIGMFILGALFGWLTERKRPRKEESNRFFVLPYYFYIIWCIFFVGIILSYFLSSPRRFYDEALLILAMTFIIVGLTQLNKKIFPIGETAGFGIMLSLFLVIYIFAMGLSDGYKDLAITGDMHVVEFKTTKETAKRDDLQIKLLRSFEKGVLINDVTKKRVSFVRWEEISAIHHTTDSLPQRSLSCIQLGINCRTPTQ